jgi:hypothetical protein
MNYVEPKAQLTCIECEKPLKQCYSFAGAFACGPCVRHYYQKRGASAVTIDRELRERSREAHRLIKRGRDLLRQS